MPAFLQSIVDMVLSFVASVEGQVSIVAVVVEFVLRLFKSDKPRSLLLVLSSALKGIGAMFSALSSLLDKIIPQRLSE